MNQRENWTWHWKCRILASYYSCKTEGRISAEFYLRVQGMFSTCVMKSNFFDLDAGAGANR